MKSIFQVSQNDYLSMKIGNTHGNMKSSVTLLQQTFEVLTILEGKIMFLPFSDNPGICFC